MFNLIIVDDEETTRDSLVELVPWYELGIDAVEPAQNGLDALELAERFNPSILLCDIRMSKMDGIELSKRIKHLYPECEIIFLSGYSDKEYLKSAIKLNAVDYLEKPVDMEVLKSVFRGTIQKLIENKRKAEEDERLKGSLNENIHILRQEIVLELILSNTDLSILSNKYDHEILLLSSEKLFRVVSVEFNWFSLTSTSEKSLVKNNILKALNSKDLFPELNFLAGFINDSCLAFIINDDFDYNKPKCMALLENLIEMLIRQSPDNYTVSVCCSASVKCADMLPQAYKFTQKILELQFYQGTNRVIHPLKAPTSNFKNTKAFLEQYKKLIRSNSANEAITIIKAFTKEISCTFDPDIRKIKNIYFNLIRILFEVTMQWDITTLDEDSDNRYLWQEVDSQVTLQQLSDFLISNIETVYKKAEDKQSSIIKVDKIIKYITENYCNNQMSLQSIAANTYLSQTYLCALFKKSTGKTINEFVTELRIEKAKELIKDSRIKLYEVTSSVGFSDVNYFSTLFKKYAGLTPSEFREKNLYDKKTV